MSSNQTYSDQKTRELNPYDSLEFEAALAAAVAVAAQARFPAAGPETGVLTGSPGVQARVAGALAYPGAQAFVFVVVLLLVFFVVFLVSPSSSPSPSPAPAPASSGGSTMEPTPTVARAPPARPAGR